MSSNEKSPYKPKVVSIFSGCGGLDYGFHMEGYETVWANDFAEWACKSFAANFGDVIHYKDITQIDPYTDKTIPDCDLVLGGFPCQDFSIIWKQPGLNGTRGGLFRHFAEFVDAKKPKAFVAENVKGLLTANGGKAIDTIIKDFESIAPGYVVNPIFIILLNMVFLNLENVYFLLAFESTLALTLCIRSRRMDPMVIYPM